MLCIEKLEQILKNVKLKVVFNVYFFFTCGDLLDAPKWDDRMKKNQVKNTQHDSGHFDIALELAHYIVE